MKAARLQAYGDADQFKLEDVPDPVAGAGEVLIEVAASAARTGLQWQSVAAFVGDAGRLVHRNN
jgi:NADPH:quinone reductase-like Zn-dependent oxidoreductase